MCPGLEVLSSGVAAQVWLCFWHSPLLSFGGLLHCTETREPADAVLVLGQLSLVERLCYKSRHGLGLSLAGCLPSAACLGGTVPPMLGLLVGGCRMYYCFGVPGEYVHVLALVLAVEGGNMNVSCLQYAAQVCSDLTFANLAAQQQQLCTGSCAQQQHVLGMSACVALVLLLGALVWLFFLHGWTVA